MALFLVAEGLIFILCLLVKGRVRVFRVSASVRVPACIRFLASASMDLGSMLGPRLL